MQPSMTAKYSFLYILPPYFRTTQNRTRHCNYTNKKYPKRACGIVNLVLMFRFGPAKLVMTAKSLERKRHLFVMALKNSREPFIRAIILVVPLLTPMEEITYIIGEWQLYVCRWHCVNIPGANHDKPGFFAVKLGPWQLAWWCSI